MAAEITDDDTRFLPGHQEKIEIVAAHDFGKPYCTGNIESEQSRSDRRIQVGLDSFGVTQFLFGVQASGAFDGVARDPVEARRQRIGRMTSNVSRCRVTDDSRCETGYASDSSPSISNPVVLSAVRWYRFSHANDQRLRHVAEDRRHYATLRHRTTACSGIERDRVTCSAFRIGQSIMIKFVRAVFHSRWKNARRPLGRTSTTMGERP